MPLEVADVIGNVKYIRNGDYRPKRGGLCPPPRIFVGGGGALRTTLLRRLRSRKNRSSYAVSS